MILDFWLAMDIILKLMGVHRAVGVDTSTPNYNL